MIKIITIIVELALILTLIPIFVKSYKETKEIIKEIFKKDT